MDADKATTSDDEVAFGWSETLQSLVSGFAEIVVVQTADFGEWFLVMMGAYFEVPKRGKRCNQVLTYNSIGPMQTNKETSTPSKQK